MTSQYIEQHLESRYIKDAILVDFLSQNTKEFGAQWKRELDINSKKIVLKAKRELTKKEIRYLQKLSDPERFQDE